MSGEQSNGVQSGDAVEQLKPVLEKGLDWLTVKPMWKGYEKFDWGGVALVGFGLWILWAFFIQFPLIPLYLVASQEQMTNLAILCALGPVLFGGYRVWELSDSRETVVELVENPTPANGAKAFDYIESDDAFTRGHAAFAAAKAMAHSSAGKIIKQSSVSVEDAGYMLTDLLHDEDEDVRMAGSEALAFYSKEFESELLKYRDDIFAALSYPNSFIQANAAIVAGNMTSKNTELADEVLDQIEPLCEDPDPDVRAATASALGLIIHQRSKDLLLQLTEDSHQEVRNTAKRALQGETEQSRPDFDLNVATNKSY